MSTILDWISGVVVALTATASINRMIKPEDSFNSSKQLSRWNPTTVASHYLFGAWLTERVTYHH